jgi:hypothetical protein
MSSDVEKSGLKDPTYCPQPFDDTRIHSTSPLQDMTAPRRGKQKGKEGSSRFGRASSVAQDGSRYYLGSLSEGGSNRVHQKKKPEDVN